MEDMIATNTKILASYCTYKALYDQQKDLYDVVADFIKYAVFHDTQSSYTQIELSNLVKKQFGITIPQLVIKTAVKRLNCISLADGYYYVNTGELGEDAEFKELRDGYVDDSKRLIKNFNEYITKESPDLLTKYNINKIDSAFFRYLLDKNIVEEDLAIIIGAYVIKHADSKDFTSVAERIKTGHILLVGMQEDGNLSDLGNWKEYLTIYLDTEIIFHLAGYNGELFQKLAFEFINLVQAVNSKTTYIKLKYFNETKTEIENFFSVAESYVRSGKNTADASSAMRAICKDCREVSDVKEKEADLYLKLGNKYHVYEEKNIDFYAEKFDKYNLESLETIAKYSDGKEDSRANGLRLTLISNINKLRKGIIYYDYRKCEYILLTQTNKTLSMSHDHLAGYINGSNQRPIGLAVTLEQLTNTIWFRLNGMLKKSSDYPLTINAVIKAQVLMSSFINKNLKELYEETQEEFSSGKIDADTLVARISNFRKKERLPEEITASTIDDDIAEIKEADLQRYDEEHSLLVSEGKRKDEQITSLKDEVADKDFIIREKDSALENASKKNDELEARVADLERQAIMRKYDDEAKELQSELDTINMAKAKYKKLRRRVSIFCGIGVAFGAVIVIYLVIKCGFGAIGDVLGVVSFIAGLVVLGTWLLFNKKIEASGVIDFISKNISKKIYAQSNQPTDEIERKLKEIETKKLEMKVNGR